MPSSAPINLVSAERASVAYGLRRVLDAVSLGVAAGDRIGIVGANGNGKSTLLSLIVGTATPDSGRVARTTGLVTGYLSQHDQLEPTITVREGVLGDHADDRWAADPRAREVVEGLLPDLDLRATVGSLSGGERRRVALAQLLVRDHDLLVLDEPTNHLDLEGITWLAGHLNARFGGQNRRALVVVTHDRWFLDAVCDRTWEVHDATVTGYEGGYAAYVLARAERQRVLEATDSRRRNLLRKELAWLRRGPPARTSKPKFRIDAANALIADEPPARDTMTLSRLATSRLGRKVLELEGVTVHRGGRTLLNGVTARFGAGDRIGVVGPNGAGKSTMIAVLTGELAPDGGRVERGKTVQIGTLTQGVGQLDEGETVLGSVEDTRRVVLAGGGEMTSTSLLERFGFAGERLLTVVGDLSGGERRRLQVVHLLLQAPNVLLLDEPTNDLDIDTLTVLEDFLDGWPGSLLVVSHDRWFLERVCDTIWALPGDGSFGLLPGGIEQYLRIRADREKGRTVRPTGGTRSAGAEEPIGAASAAERRQAAKEIGRIDRQLARVTDRERELHEALAEHAADYVRLTELGSQLKAVEAERAALEERWLELVELTE